MRAGSMTPPSFSLFDEQGEFEEWQIHLLRRGLSLWEELERAVFFTPRPRTRGLK